MDAGAITQIAQDTLIVLLKLSMPLLLVALVVGVFISRCCITPLKHFQNNPKVV